MAILRNFLRLTVYINSINYITVYVFNLTTIEEKKRVLEVLATKNFEISDKLTKNYVFSLL